MSDRKTTLQIEGMHCASCVASVEKSLRNVPGVKVASVNLATESATVEYDEQQAGFPDLKQAVEDVGYDVPENTIRRTLRIEGMHCASCVASVENALRAVEGVTDVSVNLATESAQVIYDPSRTGMTEFAAAVDSVGYELVQEEQHPEATAESEMEKDQRKIDTVRQKMWLVWGVTIPIILWMLPEMIFGYTFLGKVGYDLGMIVLSAIAVFYPGWETIRSAWKSATHLAPNMDVLIAMGTLASLATGVVSLGHQFGVGPAFHSFAGIAG
ncbi:MAG TPA: copper ion binding protein, partial [bacterium]|nr:copper ion binding protein [bacterium]